MRPTLTAEMANVIVEERVEAAERYRRAKDAGRATEEKPDVYDSVTVRLAGDADRDALRQLAERDGGRTPRGPLLVAEVDGSVLAARSLADGSAVADPFAHSAHLAELLALRAAHLRGSGQALPRRRGLAKRVFMAAGLAR